MLFAHDSEHLRWEDRSHEVAASAGVGDRDVTDPAAT